MAFKVCCPFHDFMVSFAEFCSGSHLPTPTPLPAHQSAQLVANPSLVRAGQGSLIDPEFFRSGCPLCHRSMDPCSLFPLVPFRAAKRRVLKAGGM